MSKIKIVIAAFVIVSITAIVAFVILPAQQRQLYRQQSVLAKEIRKVTGRLMIDLRQANQESLKGVPPDGQWHSRMAFVKGDEGAVEYTLNQGSLLRANQTSTQEVAQHINSLRVRRNGQSPDMLEVQIEAKWQASLVSNFKIRLLN